MEADPLRTLAPDDADALISARDALGLEYLTASSCFFLSSPLVGAAKGFCCWTGEEMSSKLTRDLRADPTSPGGGAGAAGAWTGGAPLASGTGVEAAGGGCGAYCCCCWGGGCAYCCCCCCWGGGCAYCWGGGGCCCCCANWGCCCCAYPGWGWGAGGGPPVPPPSPPYAPRMLVAMSLKVGGRGEKGSSAAGGGAA